MVSWLRGLPQQLIPRAALTIPEDAMAFIPFPDTNLVELVYNLPSGQVAENTLYFQQTTPITEATMEDLATAVGSWWATEVAPLVHDGVTLNFIRVTNMESDTAPSLEFAQGTPGEVAGANMPGNVTAAISFKTSKRGRSFRGRNYVIGLVDAQIVNDSIDAGLRTAYEDAYEALALAVDGIDCFHVVASRQEDGVVRTTGVNTPVTSYRMEGFIDSQRRRLAGRGT